MLPFLVLTAAAMIMRRRSDDCACHGGSTPCPCDAPKKQTPWRGSGASSGKTKKPPRRIGFDGGIDLNPTDPVIPGPIVVDTPPDSIPTDPGWRPPVIDVDVGVQPGEQPPDPESPNTGGGKETGGYCVPEFCLPNWGGGRTWFERYGVEDTFGCCK